MNTYSVEYFTADITVERYIAEFRDASKFIEYCRQCPNYGKSWGCPPFDFDTEAYLRQYKQARIMATKITPKEKGHTIEDLQSFILPERIRIETELLEMERTYGGRAFSYIGKCLYCSDNECTRICGKPCRHPEKVRPSLEAFGFDISKTLSELFNIELLWGKEGKLPDYLVLVSGFFHNEDNLNP